MSILSVDHLSHSFGGRVIFEDVSFRMNKGEHIGLIGANGEGKSTFMKLITNQLDVEEGKISWSKKVKTGYLDQHTVLEKGKTIKDILQSAFADLYKDEAKMLDYYNKMADCTEEEMNQMLEEIGDIQEELDVHDFYSIDAKIEEVAAALGVSALGLDTDVTALSGGQRTKVLLAKLLLEKPDILLLDEPTNYLDESHISWLKNYLLNYENAFVLISHDLPFLNEVVNVIYHVENSSITRYAGNYDEFVKVYEIQKYQAEKAYERQQQEIAKMEDFIARNKARVATRGMANSRMKKLEKMDILEKIVEKPKPEFNFKLGKTPSRFVVVTEGLVIGYDHPLSKPLNITIEKGEKIALIGSNGIGKTTLLKSIMGLIPSLNGKVELGENVEIGYFEQENSDDAQKTCIDALWQVYPSYSQYEIRSALAKCGLTTQQIESKVMVLSGGEQAKLRLCKIMNTPYNILVLDEPTNHLDQDAKDELKRSLIDFKGTILFVCHEPEFYRDIATRIINLEEFVL